jgi:hypothetical protein
MAEVIWLAVGIYTVAIVVSIAIAGLIRAMVAGLGALETRSAASPSRPVPPLIDTGADDIAAITAAVYAVIGAHRIVRIEDAAHRGAEWVAEGRLAHHHSHHPSHHPKH